ncbi:MAG: ribosomal RNA small subunit methyltransferase A [Saprospiraceae bacterium]|nr:ribosomal RNA small subunit methyltransferase A [Saprospiraceae bacterium]
MKAKKSYGQHFLIHEQVAQRIAGSLTGAGNYRNILEVGPGKGMLTKYLTALPYDLLAVEADRDMVAYLQQHYPAVTVLSADFLQLDITNCFQGEPFAIIGNFPYNISTQILFKMLDYRSGVPELVGMFQKEVAERVIAPPGSKVYGITSVLVQAFYEGKYLFTVDRRNFSPPPKVQSGVIRLIRREQPLVTESEVLFKKVVKQAFSQRRKMLRNTMKPFLEGDPLLEDPFFQQRPEQLSVADYVKLTGWVGERFSGKV